MSGPGPERVRADIKRRLRSISSEAFFYYYLFVDNVTSTILRFLGEIGIRVREGVVADGSFLPGIEVENGSLIVDRSKLKYPGDLLHEAGHLAVVPAPIRYALSGEVKIPDEHPGVVEMVAMLWSYAACLHLRVDPAVVFHEHGYYGRSQRLLFSYQMGIYPGVYDLENAGMTLSPQNAELTGREAFPVMQKWIRD